MGERLLTKIIVFITLVISLSFGFQSFFDDNPSSLPGNQTAPGTYTSSVSNPDEALLPAAWTQGANITTARLGGIGVSYIRNDSGWLYVMGGDLNFGGTIVALNERYNVNANSWLTMTPMPGTKVYFGGARLRDTIYAIAGMTNASFVSESNTVYRYNILTNSWSTGATTPVVLAGNRDVGYQDSLIYCAGGMTGGTSTAISNVYLYNARTNTWRTATALPQPRCMGAFSVKGDTLVYVGGGTSYYGGYNQVTYIGFISQANRSQITWGTAASYPGTAGFRFDAAPWGCKGIIVDGGTNNTFGSSTQCYSYSPGANSWTLQPSLPHAIGSSQTGSVIFSSGRMLLINASGEQYPTTPYAAPYTQLLTDTCFIIPSPLPVPFCQGFTSAAFPPAGWSFVYIGTLYWLRASVSGGGLGTGSTEYDMWNAPSGNNQEFITPYFSPITLPTDSLEFDYAYSPYPSTPPFYQDSLVIRGSMNNGTSWIRLAGYGPFELQTAPAQNNQFLPTAGQWGIKRILLPLGTNRISFLGKSAFGNDLFIDSICVKHPVGIQPISNGVPKVYSLSQNYPNPFNPSTSITYALPKAGNVELRVYDIIGREVTVLVNDFRQANTYTVSFDASNLASGVYFYRIKTGDFTDSKKMLLVK